MNVLLGAFKVHLFSYFCILMGVYTRNERANNERESEEKIEGGDALFDKCAQNGILDFVRANI